MASMLNVLVIGAGEINFGVYLSISHVACRLCVHGNIDD